MVVILTSSPTRGTGELFPPQTPFLTLLFILLRFLSCFCVLIGTRWVEPLYLSSALSSSVTFICILRMQCWLVSLLTRAGRSLDLSRTSPGALAHRTRVDKMTNHDNEGNEAWDRDWTSSPSRNRVSTCEVYKKIAHFLIFGIQDIFKLLSCERAWQKIWCVLSELWKCRRNRHGTLPLAPRAWIYCLNRALRVHVERKGDSW